MLKKMWKRKILDFYVNLKNKNNIGNKVLITSTDGIGDFIIRLKLLKDIGIKYGFDNCYILCDKKIESLIEKIGFKNIIIFTPRKRRTLLGKILLLSKIFKIPLKCIISLEFDQHDFDIQYFDYLNTYGYKNKYHPEMDKYYSNLFSSEGTSIEEITLNFYNNFFNRNIPLDEIVPNLIELYSGNIIQDNKIRKLTVGIGAGSRKKMMSPQKFAEIIKIFWNTKKFDIITLLGNGERDDKYLKKLNQELKYDELNICSFVGKLDLNESIIHIINSEAFLGFDSGLFHIAAILGIKTFALFSFLESKIYSHENLKNVTTFWGNSNIKNSNSNYYGTPELNNISLKEIKEKLNK